MAEKNTFQITNQSGTASIRIIGEISMWNNNSDQFTRQVDELLEAGIVNIEGYVNCYGGSMFEANEIGNQIQRFTGTKNVKVGAIAASAGGYLLTYFDKITLAKNSQIMIHDPIMPLYVEHVEDFESNKQLYMNLRNDVIDRFVNKTGISKEEISEMMRVTTWMNATTAKEKKFADEVTDEKESLPENVAESLKNISNVPEVISQQIITNQNQQNHQEMKEVLKALGLPENATEQQALEAVNKVKATSVKAVTELAKSKGMKPEPIEKLAQNDTQNTLDMVVSMSAAESETPVPATENKQENVPNALAQAFEAVFKGGTGIANQEKKFADYTPVELENLADKEPAKYDALMKAQYPL